MTLVKSPPAQWPVDLARFHNNVGVTGAATGPGAFNVWGNSLPLDQVPAGERIRCDGIVFQVPPAGDGRFDNVRCAGQLIAVPAAAYDWIYLLAAAERRVEDEVALHFTDGSIDFEAVRVSDFWVSPPVFGEGVAFATRSMHYPHHVQPRVPGTVWCQRVPVTRRGDLRAIRLPDNVALHVFAMTLRGRDTGGGE